MFFATYFYGFVFLSLTNLIKLLNIRSAVMNVNLESVL
jgi:hypothetical protein